MIKNRSNIIKFIGLFFIFIVSSLYAKEDKISLQLLWKHQFEFAGFYMAKEKGYYKNLGLDVNIKEYKFGIDIVDEVLRQKSDIGISRTSLILEKLKGKDISLLFSTYQSSPYVLISKKRDDLKTISDFKNKKIMYSDHLDSIAAISAMFKVGAITSQDYIKLPHSFKIDDLINNTTDLMAVYMSNETFYLKQKRIDFTLFNPKDYGFNFYADMVFTSNEYLKNHEQNVRNFIAASKKGWEYAFKHIDETTNVILKKYNSQNKTKEALEYEAKILKELAYEKDIPFGDIDIQRIKEIANLYKLLGLTTTLNDSLENFIYEPLTIKKILKNIFTVESVIFVICFILLFVFLAFYKQYILKQQNETLENLIDEKTKKLQLLNENLENEVIKRTKEIEEQKDELKTIFETSKDGIAIINLHSTFLYFNKAYQEMTGYTKEELYETSCISMTVEDDIPITLEMMEKVKQDGFVRNFEKKCYKKTKEIYIVNITLSLMPDKKRILMSAKDITFVKNKEKILFEQSKLASLGEMIGNIAHQWRQPLSTISIDATTLIYKNDMDILEKSELNKSLEKIHEQSQHLSKIIDTFKNYLNPNKNYIIVDLNQSIQEALTLIDASLSNNHIELIKEINDFNIQLKTPENEFVEVIFNILNNAKEQLIQNNITQKWIKITTYKKDSMAIITIEDNGGGIADEIIDKIFEPYFTTKHQSQGTGLGLHMCYKIINESLGGKIVASNTNNGALFTISIPL